MLHEILRVQEGLELADPSIMQPFSMLPDEYQDIISSVGGLRAILEQSGKFLLTVTGLCYLRTRNLKT